MLEELQQVAPTKGKQMAAAGGEIDIFVFTMNSHTREGALVDERLLNQCVPSKWFHAG